MNAVAPLGAVRRFALAHPLFSCAFRPFFLLTAIAALALLPPWAALLAGLAPLPALPGGAIAWHAHEMIFGFAYASVLGFVLTAVPEFTGSRAAPPALALTLALLWLAARLAYPLAPWVGLLPALLLNAALAVSLLAFAAPPLLRDARRAHLSFAIVLLLLAAAQIGFFAALLAQADPGRWLHAAIGLLMILIVLAQTRISMRVVNGAIDRPDADAGYRPRPPRRNLAVGCLALYTAQQWLAPAHPAGAWLALAAAAAMLNLLNDWHIGRPLLNRWSLPLYAVYWLIALGYALLSAAHFGAPVAPSAGHHLLLAGAMGLAILVVMCIAGRRHAGYALDGRGWVLGAAACVVAGAALKAAAASAALADWQAAQPLAALLFAAGFAMYLFFSAGVLTRPRPDGKVGCDEPEPAPVPIRFVARRNHREGQRADAVAPTAGAAGAVGLRGPNAHERSTGAPRSP
jgi:uncharacterized protein involved in response to NO